MALVRSKTALSWQGESGEAAKAELLKTLEGEKKEWLALMTAARQMGVNAK